MYQINKYVERKVFLIMHRCDLKVQIMDVYRQGKKIKGVGMRLVKTFYFYRERRGRGLRGRRRHSLLISNVVGSRAFRQLSCLGLRARTPFSQFWFSAICLF